MRCGAPPRSPSAGFGQFALGVVIARLLAPEDFGVFAVALVVHAVVVNISELRSSRRADPRRDEDARRGAPTVATIAIASALVLGVLMAASSGLVSLACSGHPRPPGAVAVMALTLPLAGIAAVPSAYVRRHFRMDRLFVASAANMVATGDRRHPARPRGLGPDGAGVVVGRRPVLTTIDPPHLPSRAAVRPGWDLDRGRPAPAVRPPPGRRQHAVVRGAQRRLHRGRPGARRRGARPLRAGVQHLRLADERVRRGRPQRVAARVRAAPARRRLDVGASSPARSGSSPP